MIQGNMQSIIYNFQKRVYKKQDLKQITPYFGNKNTVQNYIAQIEKETNAYLKANT